MHRGGAVLRVDVLALRRYRGLLLMSLDLGAWILSYLATAIVTRLASGRSHADLAVAVLAGVAAGALFLLLAALFKMHQGRAAVGSFEEAMIIAPLAVVAGGLVAGSDLIDRPLRATVVFGAPWMALMLMLWGRGVYRVLRDRALEPVRADDIAEPVLIIGAGNGAQQLIMALRRHDNSPWVPVALLDDDPMKRYRRVRGIPVLGGTGDIEAAARKLGVSTVILAIPTGSAELVRKVKAQATKADLTLKVLPDPYELRDPGRVGISDVRDINLTDLLGRRQIDTDLASIAGYLANKRVLVTGAGGSIGSELCRQIAQFNPRELIMLDRDESALHAIELSIYGRGLLDGDNTVLGDIRDTQFLLDLFVERRPEVVFHAAALKHLPLLEKAPGEAVKTNVWGTSNVLEAAAKSGVERFVNISTDKAANPTCVLGYSKRLAEGLTAAVAQQTDGPYLSVRFGNVLGSRGSVLTAFAAQIAAGGPVTVTDPKVTRYFMTIQEAVQLVIQAGAIGRPGEVLVLDMGEPVSIDSVARQLIELSGSDIEIVYTGLRDGEKMHEELFGDRETDLRPEHELISHAEVPPYPREEALLLSAWGGTDSVRTELHAGCEDMGLAMRQGA